MFCILEMLSWRVVNKLLIGTTSAGDAHSLARKTILTKITAAQNKVALNYHRVRGLYFLAVVSAATITL